MREDFLRALADVARDAADEGRQKTTQERINLAVFGVLGLLDGAYLDFPGCSVVPRCDHDGNEFGEDIAGRLHEDWHKFRPGS